MARKNTSLTKAPKTPKTIQTGTRGKILGLPIEDQLLHENGRTQKAPKQPKPKADKSYKAAIPATKVYFRKMPEFKNCDAACWMLVNEEAKTYTFANTYNGQLKSSFKAEHYTYELTEKAQKKVAEKIEEMAEVESPADWPTWITAATAPKKSRKSK